MRNTQPHTHTHLAVVAASGHQGSIWGEGGGGDVVVVALLLQYVAVAAPFPHQQLAQLGAAHCTAGTSEIERW
eukprot:1161962-Pelagomonas_calceolata.AAC.4